MRVSVELPDPKTSSLDAALAKQFADIQRQLLRLVEAKDESSHAMHQRLLESLEDQQTTLVSALERLMGMISHKDTGASDILTEALQGLKKTMAELPGDLKDALDRQYQSIQMKTMKSDTPSRMTIQMPPHLMDRIDSLESALLNGLRRSRSRTFGSNY